MRKNRIKEKWSQGKMAVGTYVNLADPAVVEIIGLAGFDAAFIDMEHTAFTLETVQEMLRACDLTGIASLVRVPDNNPKTILRILDMKNHGNFITIRKFGTTITFAPNLLRKFHFINFGKTKPTEKSWSICQAEYRRYSKFLRFFKACSYQSIAVSLTLSMPNLSTRPW